MNRKKRQTSTQDFDNDFDLMTRAKWQRLQSLIEKDETHEPGTQEQETHEPETQKQEPHEPETYEQEPHKLETHEEEPHKLEKQGPTKSIDSKQNDDFDSMTRAQWKRLQSLIRNEPEKEEKKEKEEKESNRRVEEPIKDNVAVVDERKPRKHERKHSIQKEPIDQVVDCPLRRKTESDDDDFDCVTRAQWKRLKSIIKRDESAVEKEEEKEIARTSNARSNAVAETIKKTTKKTSEIDSPQAQKTAPAAHATKPDVFLVDEHHLVLGGIQQHVQQQRFRNPGILINFDSHDDLAVPERVTSSLVGVKDVGAMIPHVEISSWIIPCIAAGVYDEIIWVTEYNTMFTQQTFSAGVAVRSELQTDENRDAGEDEDGDSLCIVGDDVPQEWREYWQDQYVAIAQKRAKKRCFQGTRETVTTRGTAATRQTAEKRDSATTSKPFKMTVCTRDSIAGVIAHLASTKKDITVSMDLDFFSTTNPSRRCIPFNDLPSFRLPLIDLFARIPLLTCNAFFAHLDSFLKESELTDANLDNVCRALRTALGDDSASSSSFSSVSFLSSTASHVSHRSLFATLYRLVHEHFRRAPQRAELLENLMRLALPEYKASWSEMNQSVTLFRSVYAAITSRKDCFSHLVVAQSLLYTPRRQSDAIEALFMSALE